ncbi:unnamed protein product [marine sediment metagenome]|uniref:Uncharacterized protein n=1 Tax=marine sediment metagenome TaxID=412755 RepID=X1UNY8_9ZZZZ
MSEDVYVGEEGGGEDYRQIRDIEKFDRVFASEPSIIGVRDWKFNSNSFHVYY